jgi:hypothetical protein
MTSQPVLLVASFSRQMQGVIRLEFPTSTLQMNKQRSEAGAMRPIWMFRKVIMSAFGVLVHETEGA